MKREAAIAAKWSGVILFTAIGSALAGCSGGGGGYGGSGNSRPTLSLTANPMTIALGQTATLKWTSNQGTSCMASGAWEGSEPAAGAAEVEPAATGAITYTLTCSGGMYSGSSTKSSTLSVERASVYTTTSLVEDFVGGAAATTDAHLVNPWGIAFGPTTTVGVANNHSETATLYDGNGQMSPVVVQFSSGAGAAPFGAIGKIDVFDATFAKQPSAAASFSSDDPMLPDGYAPFGIQAIRNGDGGADRIYVSYAKRDEREPDDDAPGPGLGIVDVFDPDDRLLEHLLVEGGKLNAPWGMALAPADFSTFSNALLVGNFGDVNGRALIGTATSTPFTVEWNTATVGNGDATLRAVATDDNGNVGSSPIVAVSIANTNAATLTEIQQTVFTLGCALCHDGSQPLNGSLPGSMDLRPGMNFASLVNAASREQPALMRIKPDEPENSYLIRKLEGTPGISGERMPFGGPYLDLATVERIKSWIAGGAQNN